VEERDSCALPFQRPVYELFSGKLWPVVCIEKVGQPRCVIRLMESGGESIEGDWVHYIELCDGRYFRVEQW